MRHCSVQLFKSITDIRLVLRQQRSAGFGMDMGLADGVCIKI